MRIVIDLQGAQSGSRFRGIGRYSLALATAMARNAVDDDVHVVLNGRFNDSIDPIREAFAGILPASSIHVWLPCRSGALHEEDDADELIREAFIASLKPDVVHVSSLFEGLGEPVITSIGMSGGKVPTAVTLFDLIPLIYHKPYLENPVMARWYYSKLAHLRRADLLLGISASAAREAVDYLGFDPSGVVNISSAIDDAFVRLEAAALDEAGLRRRYGLDRQFVMYTGGIDHRKNIEGLIRSFAMLPDPLRRKYQLAIVCSVRDDSRQAMMRLAKEHGLRASDLVMTGFVPEDDLVALYNVCALFVFPSWHEGFGLPALEAMQCGAPVIGANTSSLPEVIGLEEALFDPYSDQAIAEKMEQALTDPEFRQRLVDHAAVQASRFSWDESARRALRAMKDLGEGSKQQQEAAEARVTDRLRLAYVSPFPPERSGIADYSAELVPELARYYDVDVILAQDQITDMQVAGVARIRDLEWFERHGAAYDRVLYHFGNSSCHTHMPDMLERVPGVVVLHDFFLSGLFAYRELAASLSGSWTRALYHSHGYQPLPRRIGSDHDALMQDYPCNFDVLSNSMGVVVHSAYSATLADQWYGNEIASRWRTIPLMRAPVVLQDDDRRKARASLELPQDGFVVCSFGFMAPSKQNLRLLKAWLSTSVCMEPDAYLVFVGGADPGPQGAEIAKLIDSHPAGHRVRITGYADPEVFRAYLQAADAAVQLRTSSRGETSAAVLDAFNYGVPTIVNANGSFSDLPAEAVCMLSDEFSDAELAGSLEEIRRDPELRARLGAAGRALILEVHAPRRCAEMYRDAVETAYANAGTSELMKKLAARFALDGMSVDEADLGRSLAWSFPPPASARQALVYIGAECEVDEAFEAALRRVLLQPPKGIRVEPFRWCEKAGAYVYAREYSLRLVGCPPDLLPDEPLDIRPGDLVLSGPSRTDTIQDRALVWRGASFGSFSEWFGSAYAADPTVFAT